MAIQVDESRRELCCPSPPSSVLTAQVKWKGDKKSRECQFALILESEVWLLQANDTVERNAWIFRLREIQKSQ